MMIPKDVLDKNTDYVNLLTNHGKFNLNMIKKSLRDIYQKGIKSSTRYKYDVSLPDELFFKIW